MADQPKCCVFSLSIINPFPDVAALIDLLYISRSSAVRPIFQIQSTKSFSRDLFGLSLFIWPLTFPSSSNSSAMVLVIFSYTCIAFIFKCTCCANILRNRAQSCTSIQFRIRHLNIEVVNWWTNPLWCYGGYCQIVK